MTLSPIATTALVQHRQNFPTLANKAYFNYGGQGTMPKASLEAIYQAHEYLQSVGPFSGEVNGWLNREEARTRQTIAQALGATSDTLTLTENVTMGCNIALWGLDWQAGDHLLLSDCEHQGVIAAVQELQHRFGIEVSTCPLQATLNGGDPVAVVANHLRPNTRLVVLSHILWNTGQVLPLAEIVALCREHRGRSQPVQVLVDAAQSVGMLPLNLSELGADFYAFTGHKWWCGPAGVGGLYIRPEARESLRPTFIGWRGVVKDESGYPIGYLPDGRQFEVATSDYPLYGALRAAISLHDQWGTASDRYQQIRALSGNLWQKLAALPSVVCLRTAPPESGLVSFQVPGRSHDQLVKFLETRGFLLRVLLDPNCVRACVHYFTLEEEIDRLVNTVAEFIASAST